MHNIAVVQVGQCRQERKDNEISVTSLNQLGKMHAPWLDIPYMHRTIELVLKYSEAPALSSITYPNTEFGKKKYSYDTQRPSTNP